jgi:hypothetical protein
VQGTRGAGERPEADDLAEDAQVLDPVAMQWSLANHPNPSLVAWQRFSYRACSYGVAGSGATTEGTHMLTTITGTPPTSTTVEVARLVQRDALVEVELVAAIGR